MKDDQLYLLHIRDAINRVREYTRDGQQAFLSDLKTQDAVLRNLEVIGEATKNLSPELRTANSDIPWKQIAGLRDTLIHQYFGVRLDLVWEVVEKHLPELHTRVTSLLAGPSSP